MTKDYPDEPSSGLDRPGAFRADVGADREEFVRWSAASEGRRPSEVDVVLAGPTYAAQGWLCIVDPGPVTDGVLRDLLASAHVRAQARWGWRRG